MITPTLLFAPPEEVLTASSVFGPPPNHWLLGWLGTVLYLAFAGTAIFFFMKAAASRFRLLQVGRKAARFDRLWDGLWYELHKVIYGVFWGLSPLC